MINEELKSLLDQVKHMEYAIRQIQRQLNPRKQKTTSIKDSKYAFVSNNADVLPGQLVRLGKEYQSGLVRCKHRNTVYIIHKKFLTNKNTN